MTGLTMLSSRPSSTSSSLSSAMQIASSRSIRLLRSVFCVSFPDTDGVWSARESASLKSELSPNVDGVLLSFLNGGVVRSMVASWPASLFLFFNLASKSSESGDSVQMRTKVSDSGFTRFARSNLSRIAAISSLALSFS